MSATSIATELTRIQTAKADIKTAIEAKGVQVPSNALIDTYDTYIGQISGGGGGQAEQDLKDLIERDITSITIPSGVTSIGQNAFNSCIWLRNITIPNSVTSIGNNAFYNCTVLTSITIPSGVTSISDGTFQYCYGLTSVTIPNGVTSIGVGAFRECTSLTSITIPNSVTTIVNSTTNGAFQGCTGLTSVTIGNGITNIGNSAFRNCGSLTTMTVEATTPPTLGNNALNGTNANLVIYVPAESVETYKTTGNWVSFASKIQAIPS